MISYEQVSGIANAFWSLVARDAAVGAGRPCSRDEHSTSYSYSDLAGHRHDVMVLHDLVLLPEPPRFSLPRLRASRRRHSVRIDHIRCDASDGV